MVINFNKTLPQALKIIKHAGLPKYLQKYLPKYLQKYYQFLIHEQEHPANHAEIFEDYKNAKWKIIDLLNEHCHSTPENHFDLHHWLNYNQEDEAAYFLNEAGSNALHHSQFKAPFKFHLWLGEKGFIIGIEQKGFGFDAENVYKNKIKDNEGAAFDFFRRCKSSIFFDDKQNTKTIYIEHIF